MASAQTTVIGIFLDITAAKKATDELHDSGISTARLVENDRLATFPGTADDSDEPEEEGYSPTRHLIIIENCSDVSQSREIILRFGGKVEEKDQEEYDKEQSLPSHPEQPGL